LLRDGIEIALQIGIHPGFNACCPAILDRDSGDFDTNTDVDPQPATGLGIAPQRRIMVNRSSFRVILGANNRQRRPVGVVQRRGYFLDLFRAQYVDLDYGRVSCARLLERTISVLRPEPPNPI
jgi:hypothetical protein